MYSSFILTGISNRLYFSPTKSTSLTHRIMGGILMLYKWKSCMCKLAFQHCGKVTEINNLREEILILVLGFRGFTVWMTGSTAFSLWWSSTSWWGICMVKQSCSPHGQEAESRRDWWQNNTFQRHSLSQSSHFLQSCFTLHSCHQLSAIHSVMNPSMD